MPQCVRLQSYNPFQLNRSDEGNVLDHSRILTNSGTGRIYSYPQIHHKGIRISTHCLTFNAMSTVDSAISNDAGADQSCTDIVSVKQSDNDSDNADSQTTDLSLFDDSEADPNDSAYVSKLEGLGPIILNSDGTMGRIPNWSEYTDSEKAQAMRLIGARNKKRKEALLQARKAEAEAASQSPK